MLMTMWLLIGVAVAGVIGWRILRNAQIDDKKRKQQPRFKGF
jgi:hypothetical protein